MSEIKSQHAARCGFWQRSRATIAGAYFAYTRYSGRGKAGITSLAVLPFANTSNDPEKEYLSDGISESLINQLSQLPGVKVIANTSSSKYKGKNADPQDIARALDVGAVLTGKVLQHGDDLSISVELVDARDRTHLWGAQYNRKATDMLAVQAEISREIAEKLRLRLHCAQQRVARMRVEPFGLRALAQGRFYHDKGGAETRRTPWSISSGNCRDPLAPICRTVQLLPVPYT